MVVLDYFFPDGTLWDKPAEGYKHVKKRELVKQLKVPKAGVPRCTCTAKVTDFYCPWYGKSYPKKDVLE